jgi:hypothetical protein
VEFALFSSTIFMKRKSSDSRVYEIRKFPSQTLAEQIFLPIVEYKGFCIFVTFLLTILSTLLKFRRVNLKKLDYVHLRTSSMMAWHYQSSHQCTASTFFKIFGSKFVWMRIAAQSTSALKFTYILKVD